VVDRRFCVSVSEQIMDGPDIGTGVDQVGSTTPSCDAVRIKEKGIIIDPRRIPGYYSAKSSVGE
jgi:hypothetical protein